MTVLQVSTRSKREIVDLTRLFQKELPQIKKANGLCHLFLLHTTAALTTADLDPGTDLDLLDAFDAVIPKLNYRHPHDPEHVPDHILSSLIGTSLLFPVKNGEPLLGDGKGLFWWSSTVRGREKLPSRSCPKNKP